MSHADELMDELRERARREHPHRFAPDGTGLSTYDSTCRHDQETRTRGCGDAWAHRLGAWERIQELREAMERDQLENGEGAGSVLPGEVVSPELSIVARKNPVGPGGRQ